MMANTNTEESAVPKTSNQCFICNCRIVVSKRNCFEIFGKHVTGASGSPLHTVIGRALELELLEDSVHSSIICKLCLKLLNQLDEVEVQLVELKTKLQANYQHTINELSANLPELDGIDGDNALEASAEADEENIKYEAINGTTENVEQIEEYVQEEEYVPEEECVEEEECVREEDIVVPEDEEAGEGVYGDDVGEVAADDDPDYLPEEEDTNVDHLMTASIKCKKEVKKSPKALPGKIVERDGKYFVCLLCDGEHKIMGDRRGITNHLKDIHSVRVYICDLCLECFTRRYDLSEHLDNHVTMEEGDFQCEVCNQVFHNRSVFELHKRVHFPQLKVWNCEICGKNYASRNLLEEHMNTHTGLRPYSCEQCGKSFASRATYRAHMKTHEVRDRSFSCGVCGKAYFRAQSLLQHELMHNDSRDYVCEHCGKAFVTAHNLQVHSIVHNSSKEFACPTCGKEFLRRFELVVHQRIHTGEKPFQCELCGAAFTHSSNLWYHKRAMHLQDKRYKCSMCDKGYKRQRLLDYHIKAAHTGERPYKCQTCSATFIYPHRFKKHCRMHMNKP